MSPDVLSSPGLTNPRSESHISDTRKSNHLRRMEITLTRKRLIHSLVLILACISIFRLLRFIFTSYSSPPRETWTGPTKVSTPTSSYFLYARSKPATKKEFRFLSNIISQKSPCNILIFGWDPQYRHLAKINTLGKTVFLEDNPERIRRLRRSNNTRIYKVNYETKAKEAYKLLKSARDGPECGPNMGLVEKSMCKLALLGLPEEVYKIKWDVIVVDGPGSDGPEEPGRMTSIYTAGMIARSRDLGTNVVVHDVDRIIEKWYAREFLCEENLVSSKGRFWNFNVKGGDGKFCSQGSQFND